MFLCHCIQAILFPEQLFRSTRIYSSHCLIPDTICFTDRFHLREKPFSSPPRETPSISYLAISENSRRFNLVELDAEIVSIFVRDAATVTFFFTRQIGNSVHNSCCNSSCGSTKLSLDVRHARNRPRRNRTQKRRGNGTSRANPFARVGE